VRIELTRDDLTEIDRAASQIEVHGARYPEHLQKLVGRQDASDTRTCPPGDPLVKCIHQGISDPASSLKGHGSNRLKTESRESWSHV
jgi:hypothetical protein